MREVGNKTNTTFASAKKNTGAQRGRKQEGQKSGRTAEAGASQASEPEEDANKVAAAQSDDTSRRELEVIFKLRHPCTFH